MPLVIKPIAFACRAERLARAGASPDGSIVGPTSSTQRKTPDSNSGKEVALVISNKLIWSYIFNAPFINNAGCNASSRYQVAQPIGCEWVDFVVVGAHGLAIVIFMPNACATDSSSIAPLD